MKIRTQFYIFLGGIIFIPMLVMGVIGLLQYYTKPERLLLPGYDEIRSLSYADINPRDWNMLQRMLQYIPASVEIAVLTDENDVVFSTIPEIRINDFFTNEAIFDFMRVTGRNYYYQLEIPSKKTKSPFYVISRIARMERRRPGFFLDMYQILLIVFTILIGFCAVMLMVIVRSITNSITVLEKATRQISLGNLDEEVTAKGSNEITSLTKSLNRMRLSLKEDQRRRSRFIMGVSHDLRTPVALIKGYTEAISDGLVDDPEMRKKSLEIIGNKITQLEDMIDELINFVKLDTGEWRQNLIQRPLFPFLDDFARRLKSDGNLLSRMVETSVLLPPELTVAFDEKLFLRALENLTSNALRYTEDGGTVSFTAEYQTSASTALSVHSAKGSLQTLDSDGSGRPAALCPVPRIVITVSDNGCGIADADLPFIFEPFYRGSNSRREKGNGLGLSVVKSIITSHGWNIAVSSVVEGMCSFVISLPISAETARTLL